MLDRDVESLKREIETARNDFDRWIEHEMQSVRRLASERQEERTRQQAEVANCLQRKEAIERQIEQAAIEKKSRSESLKKQEAEQLRMKDEIAMIPQSVQYLEKLQFLLKTKQQRLENITTEMDGQKRQLLKAMEGLYGLEVVKEENKIIFHFTNTDSVVEIQEDSTHTFTINRTPLSVKRVQQGLMDEFNTDKNLFKLLLGIRNSI